MQRTNMAKRERHYIEAFLPFYYLLAQYNNILLVGPGTIGLFIVTLFTLSKGRFRWKKQYNVYGVFLLYILFRDVVNIFSNGDVQTQFNRIFEYVVIFILVFIVCSKDFDENVLYKTWKIAGIIYTIGLIYHIAMIHGFGQSVSPISLIPGYSFRGSSYVISRPSSFFAESAAFVTAMIPLEFMALRRKDYKWAAFSTLAILASTSTVGVFLSAVLWCYKLLESSMKKSHKYVLGLSLIIVVAVFLNLPIFQDTIFKAENIIQGGGTLGSRVIGGFEVIGAMDWYQWIFGSSIIDVNTFVGQNIGKFTTNSTVLVYYRVGNVFLNTFCEVIFRYGLIGLILMMRTYLGKLKWRWYESRGLIFLCLAAIFGQTMLLNPYYFQMTMLILLYYNYKHLSFDNGTRKS